jgi:hypothetical protein
MDSETVILHKSFPNPQKEPMSLTDLISIYPPMKATNFFGLQAFYAQPDPDIVTSAPGYTVLTTKQTGFPRDPSDKILQPKPMYRGFS